jgi:hypothetical protein
VSYLVVWNELILGRLIEESDGQIFYRKQSGEVGKCDANSVTVIDQHSWHQAEMARRWNK